MTRKPDDWMPLNIRKYLGDTMHLTRDQHGAYLLLLMAYWMRGGPLPGNDNELAAIARASVSEWRKLKPVLAPFFDTSGGNWVQRRAEKELDTARELTRVKSEAGRIGGKISQQRQKQKRSESEAQLQADDEANDKHRTKQTEKQTTTPLPTTSNLVRVSEEAKASSGASADQVSRETKPAWWPQRDRYGRVTSEITEKIMFDVGKAVLGSSAGGQITRMRKAYQGDMRAVVDFLLQADEKSSPAEWFAGVLKRAEKDQHDEPKHSIYPAETHH